MPLFFKVDLIHVNINSGDVLIATLDPNVLQKENKKNSVRDVKVELLNCA